jgi:hypothetical protein
MEPRGLYVIISAWPMFAVGVAVLLNVAWIAFLGYGLVMWLL